MTGNHYKWQHRWRLDAATSTWHHDTGLAVQCGPTGKAYSLNGPQITTALEPQHGPHNAPAMVRRLLREAERLQAQQPAQGAQNARR